MSMKRHGVQDQAAPFDTEADTWFTTWNLLSGELRRLAVPTLVLALAFGLSAVAIRFVLPERYTATSDVMIDPRGFQVFKNDLTTGQYDANAAVNFVESQIHVMTSSTVLARAIQYASGAPSVEPPSVAPTAIEQLRRAVGISRAERSYILSVSVRDSDPVQAANLTNSLVRAYLDEDAINRAQGAARLTTDLSARLDQLRERLATSETAAENYRRENNLVSLDDRLLIDQQLADAVKSLGASEERLSAMRALSGERLASDPKTALSLASPSDQSLIAALIARQTAAREEIARLSTRLGNQHPTLRSARSQAAEIDGLVEAEMNRVRTSGASELRKAKEERDDLASAVTTLTEKSEKARRSSIGLRTLEQQIASNRELLSSFETRAQEAAEFGKIDSANIRILSAAYPPVPRGALSATLPWFFAGVALGLIVGLAWAVLRALIRFSITARRTQDYSYRPDEVMHRSAIVETLPRADRFPRSDLS